MENEKKITVDMATLAKVDATAIENPELMDLYIGDDEAAALAKAQELVPELTADEFAIYRADRINTYPEMMSLVAIVKKAQDDKIFAAKLSGCETAHDVYVLGGDLVTVSEERFESICQRFLDGVSKNEDGSFELTDDELAMVVGGGFFSAVGKFMVKYSRTIISVAKTAASVAIGAMAAACPPLIPAAAGAIIAINGVALAGRIAIDEIEGKTDIDIITK